VKNGANSVNELPKGWVLLRVKDSIKQIPISNKKVKKKDYLLEGPIPVVDQGQDTIGGYTDKIDFIINKDKKAVIVFGDHTRIFKYITYPFVAGADGIKILQPQLSYNPKLLYYFLKSVQFPNKGYSRHYQYLAKSLIPLPPLPEQNRIVAKIEELFTRLDAGVAALQKAKTLLKKYRQSVLKAAVEGKLTEEWRRENRSLPAPRPGKFYVYVIKCSNGSNYIGQTNDLPKRYREHKEGRGADWTRKYPPQYVMYWEELDSRKAAVEREKWLKTGFGRKWIKRSEKAGRMWHAGEIEPASVLLERIQAERKARLGKKYKPPKPIDTTNLPELPDGWVWARVEEVSLRIHYGYTASSINDPAGPTMLRITDIQNRNVNWSTVPY